MDDVRIINKLILFFSVFYMEKYIRGKIGYTTIFGEIKIPQVNFSESDNIWIKIGDSEFAEKLISPKRVWCRNFIAMTYESIFRMYGKSVSKILIDYLKKK